MLSNYDVIDDFDDEPQDLSLDEEDNADIDNDFSDDDDLPEEEPEIVEKQDESDESTLYDRITETLGEDELKDVLSSLPLVKPEDALFRIYEQNNHAYRDAMTAYFEEKNYQQAIEKFNEAIADASQRTARNLTAEQAGEIVAKSMYWQAEACIKMQNVQQAVEIFKALIQNCQGHYLTLAARRRTDELNAKDS